MKVVPIDLWPLWALIETVILQFQGNSSPLDIRQHAEHLLHEYKLDDDTLQTAQLEQKILQDFPTNPAPRAPPLPKGTYPNVSPSIKPNDFDKDSPKTPFNIKTDNTLLNNNNLLDRGSLSCWLCNCKSLKLKVSLPFQFFFISWRLITLQYCSGFCHTLT